MGAQMPYQPNFQRRKRPYVSPFYFNFRDECWPVAFGVARVSGPEGEMQAGPGDMAFGLRGEFHNFEAVTMVKVVWSGDPIPGQKSKGDMFL
jgi:hypothetical protein